MNHVLTCGRCHTHGGSNYFFERTKTWVSLCPVDRLIHVHFGESTWSKEIGKEEAHWLYHVIVNQIYAAHPDITFFTIMNFGGKGLDDYFSVDSLRLFSKIGHHPQTSDVVHHKTNSAFIRIAASVMRIARTEKNLHISTSLAEAEEHYQRWAAKHMRTTV